MATITDSGDHLKIVNGSKIDYVNKSTVNVSVNGDKVFIEEGDGETHSFNYSEVTSPAAASAAALAEAIIALI